MSGYLHASATHFHHPDPMRLFFSSLFVGLAVVASAQAPSIEWVTGRPMDLTGSTFYDSPPFQIAADPAGGAVMTGLEVSSMNYSAQAYGALQYVHFTADGTVDLERSMPGNAGGGQLRYTSTGDVYMTGTFLNMIQLDAEHELTTSDNFPHPFLAKLNGAGDVLWAYDLNVLHGATYVAKGLAVNDAGDVFVGMHVANGARIIRYDGSGYILNTIVQTTFDVSSIDVDPLGNLYVAGACVPLSGADFGGVHYLPPTGGGGYNRYLVRYNASGVPTFIRFTEDVTCTDAMVRCHGDNSVYWSGSFITPTTFGTFELSGPSNGGTPDVFLARLDSSGTYSWAIEGPNGDNVGIGIGRLSYLEVDADGNALIAGQVRGNVTWPDGSTTITMGSYDPIVVSYDPDGDFRWAKQGMGSGTIEGAHTISLGPDGSAYLVGLTRTSCSFDGLSVTSNNTTNFPFVAKIQGAISTGVNDVARMTDINLAPNPASDQLRIGSIVPVLTMRCSDVMGRTVSMERNNNTVDVSALKPGVYFLEVRTEQEIRILRFVKE